MSETMAQWELEEIDEKAVASIPPLAHQPLRIFYPINPWQPRSLEAFRDVIRVLLWICLMINGLIVGIFTIAFTYHFIQHLWDWLDRILFSHRW